MSTRNRLLSCLTCLLLIGTTYSGCNTPHCIDKGEGHEPEIVIQNQVDDVVQKRRTYTRKELEELEAAKDVVKKYWVSSHEQVYNLLSSKEKQRLKTNEGISTATEYAKSIPESERVWMKQTYQKADLDEYGYISITVLAEWEEEGYMGVMTFIFDMAKEKDEWKIAHIMY